MVVPMTDLEQFIQKTLLMETHEHTEGGEAYFNDSFDVLSDLYFPLFNLQWAYLRSGMIDLTAFQVLAGIEIIDLKILQ